MFQMGVTPGGHQIPRLCLKAWMFSLTRRLPPGRAGVRIWARGIDRVAGTGERRER